MTSAKGANLARVRRDRPWGSSTTANRDKSRCWASALSSSMATAPMPRRGTLMIRVKATSSLGLLISRR